MSARFMKPAVMLLAAVSGLLVAQNESSPLAPSTAYGASQGSADIYVMSPTGKRQRRVTRGSFGEVAPSWSPDGNRIAFARARKPGHGAVLYDLWVANADGRGVRRLFRSNRREGPVSAIGWSPGGETIAVSSGFTSISLVDVASGLRRRIAEDPSANEGRSFSTQFHPGGYRVFYDTGPLFASVDLLGESRHESQPATEQISGFDISPNGEDVVYVRDYRHLWTMKIDGTNRRKLRSFRGSNTTISSPTYSGNGERIAFALGTCRGKRYEQSVRVTGLRARALKRVGHTTGWWATEPDWSSKGEIAFIRMRPWSFFEDPCRPKPKPKPRARPAVPQQPPEPVASPEPRPPSGPARRTDLNCDDFPLPDGTTAQEYLERYPDDPSGLDRDNDGLACESYR